MKPILRIILLSICLYSCADNHEVPHAFEYNTEVIAVFTPLGIGNHSSSGLIYKGIIKATDALNISFRPIFPLTYEDGAEIIAQLAGADQKGRKRLIISTDPEYSDYLRETASKGLILDSESTKLLVLDGDLTHTDIHTAYIPFYGMMYKAGYVASRMTDVKNVRIDIANHKYRYIREGRDGFIDGFAQNTEGNVDIVDYSTSNDDNTEGFIQGTFAYITSAYECSGIYDMVLPICGETIMGYLRYNREHPGSFYTVGVENDMSVYSSDVPFSCVEHLDRIVSACITDWVDNRLEQLRTFGLEDGWVELVVSENYKTALEPFSKEIHAKALEMEERYEN